MEPTDVAIDILRKIQAGIAASNERLAAVEAGIMGLAAATNAGLERLESAMAEGFIDLREDIATTNETLGLIHHRLQFAEAASAAATAARSRVEDRMDRLEARVDALEGRNESGDD